MCVNNKPSISHCLSPYPTSARYGLDMFSENTANVFAASPSFTSGFGTNFKLYLSTSSKLDRCIQEYYTCITGKQESKCSFGHGTTSSVAYPIFLSRLSDYHYFAAKCPPCFNCMLPAFTCGQYGECSEYDGQCKCPSGWAGIDCLTPRMYLLNLAMNPLTCV